MLQAIPNQNKRCPVVGMAKGIGGKLTRTVKANSGAGEVLGGELAVKKFGLDLLEGLGFGFALGEVGVELLHQEGCASVADVPERS